MTSARTASDFLMHAALAFCVAAIPMVATAAEVAFALPDAVTKDVPYAAFRIERGDGSRLQTVASQNAIAACDTLVFVPDAVKGVSRVVFATAVHGRNIVIDKEHPRAVVACAGGKAQKVALSDAALRVWRDVVSPDRGSAVERPASTRGQEAATKGAAGSTDTGCGHAIPGPCAPVFDASESRIAAGERALYVTWIGGTGPFSVEVVAAETGKRIAVANGIQARHVTLPTAVYTPGRHELVVLGADRNGFSERDLIVVSPETLPAMPQANGVEKLSADERELVRLYWLEGVANGVWAFEAMQRAASLAARQPGAAQWLSFYGETP